MQGLPEDELQRELADMPLHVKAEAINSLLKQHRLQIFKGTGDTLVYKEMTGKDIQRPGIRGDAGVSVDSAKGQCWWVCHLWSENHCCEPPFSRPIECAWQCTGMWTKDMKFQSNLQQPQITKILKTLESRKLIKAVKSVSGGNRKVYMLYELEPSRELTGGA
eukprot:scaffold455207_cov42-Prasinocladus_malaysianus.AAC.1